MHALVREILRFPSHRSILKNALNNHSYNLDFKRLEQYKMLLMRALSLLDPFHYERYMYKVHKTWKMCFILLLSDLILGLFTPGRFVLREGAPITVVTWRIKAE